MCSVMRKYSPWGKKDEKIFYAAVSDYCILKQYRDNEGAHLSQVRKLEDRFATLLNICVCIFLLSHNEKQFILRTNKGGNVFIAQLQHRYFLCLEIIT